MFLTKSMFIKTIELNWKPTTIACMPKRKTHSNMSTMIIKNSLHVHYSSFMFTLTQAFKLVVVTA